MAKDIGHVLSMILMPSTSWDPLAGFLKEGIIHDKKQNIADGNLQPLKELMQSGLRDLLHSPTVLSQEPGKTGERCAVHDRVGKGSHHGGGVNFFPQLDETDDEAREKFKRRS